jgi:hypothetical protein
LAITAFVSFGVAVAVNEPGFFIFLGSLALGGIGAFAFLYLLYPADSDAQEQHHSRGDSRDSD